MAIGSLAGSDSEESRWRTLAFCALAIVATAAAYGTTTLVPRIFGRLPFAPFFIIGGFVTLVGGRGPGLLMVALSFLVTRELGNPPVELLDRIGAVLVALPAVWLMDQHRRAVQAVLTSERRYARVCDLSSDAILTADLQGRVVSVNEAGTRLVGLPASSILGRDTLEFLAMEDQARAREARQCLLSGNPQKVLSLDVNIVRADGTLRTVDARSGLAVSAGKVVGFHTIARDMTERLRLEQQLRHGQRMEAIGRLAGGVAHDFNNLLMAIRGFTDLASSCLHPEHPATEHLTEVMRCCDQSARIVGQLLAFGRRQPLRPVIVNTNEALAGLEPILQRLLGSEVALASEYQPEVGSVRVDPHQLTQVLMNLAVNARDAMPTGGRLTVSTRTETVPARRVREGVEVEAGSYVVISVADDGSGMDEETLGHIFEPFFTTKREGKGTGLGLATVYGIVKQSGGYIWVESTPGRGTKFDVHLPKANGAC